MILSGLVVFCTVVHRVWFKLCTLCLGHFSGYAAAIAMARD
jgi:hypothetical protein